MSFSRLCSRRICVGFRGSGSTSISSGGSSSRRLPASWVGSHQVCGAGVRRGLSSAAKEGATKSKMPPPHPKSTLWSKFWTWTTQERPDLERWSALWWREQTLLCTVFAITGSSSLVVVRPVLKKVLGLEGSFKEGPWSYRIISLVLCSPAYTALLLTFGTLAGRHNKFAGMARQMWGRFLPRSMAKDLGCAPAKMKQSVKQSVQQQQGSKKAP